MPPPVGGPAVGPPTQPKPAPPMAPPGPPAAPPMPSAPPAPAAPAAGPANAPAPAPAPAAPEAAPGNPKLATPADPSDAEAGAADNTTLTETGESGTTTFLVGDNARIPEDFPKDVPLYKDMKIETLTKSSEDGVYAISAVTPDPYAEVAKSFKEQAKANQWKEDMSTDQEGQMCLMTYSKDSRTLSVMVMKDDDQSSIQLTVGKTKEE